MYHPASLRSEGGQASPGLGGNLPVVHVAVFTWTGWQLSRGLSGNLPMDWVAGIRGIRKRSRDGKAHAANCSSHRRCWT